MANFHIFIFEFVRRRGILRRLLAIAKCCWIGEFFYGRCISRKTQDTTRALNFTKSSFPCLCRVPRKSPRFYRSAKPREHCGSPEISKLPNIRKSANLSKFSAFLRTLAKSPKLYEISDIFEIARHRRIYRDHEIFPTARKFHEISVLARDRSIFRCRRNFPTSAPASSLRIPGICYREIGWNCRTRPDRRKGKATCAEPHVSPNHRK